MANNINITIGSKIFKSYVRNNKSFFAITENGKTKNDYTEEEFNRLLTEAQAPAPEAKTRAAKGTRYADADQAKAVALAAVPTDYTTNTDTRGRVTYKQDKTVITMVQPAKTHYTVYVSKHLLATPDQVIDALKSTFKIEAKVNPTYIVNKGHDAFSVKATITGATPDQLDNMVDLLIAKNNEVVKA